MEKHNLLFQFIEALNGFYEAPGISALYSLREALCKITSKPDALRAQELISGAGLVGNLFGRDFVPLNNEDCRQKLWQEARRLGNYFGTCLKSSEYEVDRADVERFAIYIELALRRVCFISESIDQPERYKQLQPAAKHQVSSLVLLDTNLCSGLNLPTSAPLVVN